MAQVLFLAHRIPYPPNKGDKVRSYNLLRHLCVNNNVFLGTFVDDPDDFQYVDALKEISEQVFVARLRPRIASVRSMVGFLSREALTLPYYRSSLMQEWVWTCLSNYKFDCIVVFSSAMAQYVEVGGAVPVLVDFVDMDSAKWAKYSESRGWPLSWLYRREGARLLHYETKLVSSAEHSFMSTESEVALFKQSLPDGSFRLSAMQNGVDFEYFSPDSNRLSPYPTNSGESSVNIVFTGAMDYWPNIDAVHWFVTQVLPKVCSTCNSVRFYIVGRNPVGSVLEMASDSVHVTGTVPDVRPYLQYADVVVAPLRVARGVQNKILEAMSMARPVVAAEACVSALGCRNSGALRPAKSADDFADQLNGLLKNPREALALGLAARAEVIDRFSWDAHLSVIDSFINSTPVTIENVGFAP